jgi:hypothetical protein
MGVTDRFVTVGGRRISPGHWMIEVLVHPKESLEEGYQREVINGRSVLVHVNAKTGERRVVIHWRGADPIAIFRASIHEATGAVTVELDRDLFEMNWADYEAVGSV